MQAPDPLLVNKPGLTQFLPGLTQFLSCHRKSFRKAAAHPAFKARWLLLPTRLKSDLNSFSPSNKSLPIPAVPPHDPEPKDKHANDIFQEGQAGKKDSSVPR